MCLSKQQDDCIVFGFYVGSNVDRVVGMIAMAVALQVGHSTWQRSAVVGRAFV